MDDETFWAIVEAAREHGATWDDTFDGRVEGLRDELAKLSAEEILAFRDAFLVHSERAYTWELWAAAHVLGGGCSDDGFTDFRSWLISMGRQTYERALKDPDSLADIQFGPGREQDSFFEEPAYVAAASHEAKTGRSIPWDRPRPEGLREAGDPPSGEPWETDDDLERLVPRLWLAAKTRSIL